MGRLKGKVAFITGGASGFGRAAALRIAREGAKVGLLDIAEEGGRATARAVEDAGGEALFVPADVRDEAGVRAAVDAAAERFGRLDILFNNAGRPSPHRQTPIEDVPQEDWDHILDTNLKGMFLAAKAVGPPHAPRRRRRDRQHRLLRRTRRHRGRFLRRVQGWSGRLHPHPCLAARAGGHPRQRRRALDTPTSSPPKARSPGARRTSGGGSPRTWRRASH